MSVRRLLLSIAVGTASYTSALAAQSTSIVGSWNIEYERGRRVENDVVTPVMGKGVITVSSQGDSLVAVLTSGPTPSGATPLPMTFSGRLTPAGALFVQKQQSRVVMNDQEQLVNVTVTWTLSANGDALSGTLLREAPMLPEAAQPTPVTGSRVKS